MASDELGLEIWLTPMVPFALVYDLGMSLACTTFMFSFRNGRHAEHLQWKLMRKAPMAWANLYRAVSLGMGDRIYSRYEGILTVTACPTRGPWFGKLMKG